MPPKQFAEGSKESTPSRTKGKTDHKRKETKGSYQTRHQNKHRWSRSLHSSTWYDALKTQKASLHIARMIPKPVLSFFCPKSASKRMSANQGDGTSCGIALEGRGIEMSQDFAEAGNFRG